MSEKNRQENDKSTAEYSNGENRQVDQVDPPVDDQGDPPVDDQGDPPVDDQGDPPVADRGDHRHADQGSELGADRGDIASRVSHKSKSRSSRHSVRSKSTKSSVGMLLITQRAKAEAARTTLAYAQKEAELKKQQALLEEKEQLSVARVTRHKRELDADLHIIQHEKEAAAAQAEIRVIEAAIDEELEDIPLSDVTGHTEKPDATARTREYIQQLPVINIAQASSPPQLQPTEVVRPIHPLTRDTALESTNIAQFLLRKELLLSRLVNFNDQPETYILWKTSFLSVTKEANVSPQEELDLLVRWLGTESSRQAISVRAANSGDPVMGLRRLWARLHERYGSPEMVEAALKLKLATFPKLGNRDNKKLYDLSDLVSEIEAVKENEMYRSLLGYFDSSSGVIPIVNKLPYALQEKWTSRAASYKSCHKVSFPPFSLFAGFLREISRVKNDPCFAYDNTTPVPHNPQKKDSFKRPTVSARKTKVEQKTKPVEQERELNLATHCPVHSTRHTLNECHGFRKRPIDDRKEFIKEKGICYRCCLSDQHIARACSAPPSCSECDSKKHPTALHVESSNHSNTGHPMKDGTQHSGERQQNGAPTQASPIKSTCTQICEEGSYGKSCSKTVLVYVYPRTEPQKRRKMYALLDDQSNASLARSTFFELMGTRSGDVRYTLSSCTGSTQAYGRRASGYVVESIDGTARLDLPPILECDQIPDFRGEIPTPKVASQFPHLRDISQHIPEIDPHSDILLLVGRDLPEAHHVLNQRTGPRSTPYAQKLPLGWVIVGEACLGKLHNPSHVNVNKTQLLVTGRSTTFDPCPSKLHVKIPPNPDCHPTLRYDNFGRTVFERTKEDNQEGSSVDDRKFVEIMNESFCQDHAGNWEAPLPFRENRPRLPNNKSQAINRANLLDRSLKKNSNKCKHFITFMQGIFDRGHAEEASPLECHEECWYLPIFGVYHPKKPNQIRGVFDSSAKFGGTSLNDVLLKGPDLMNSLLGILLRFRKEAVAIIADIEQMFYCFRVSSKHRNYLRFLWYRNNDPSQELIEHRMCVHVFGNSPSPAVATYGLRKAIQGQKDRCDEDVKEFVRRNFYVDDGLSSFATTTLAINVLKNTKLALQEGGNIRLCKIASNQPQVMTAFDPEDLAKDLEGLDFGSDSLPLQRSLGLAWNLEEDAFTFRISNEEKPYTRRGVLSVVNSLFDPIGFIAPVAIEGKILLQSLISKSKDWDGPLPSEDRQQWEKWRESLRYLDRLKIPLMYSRTSMSELMSRELHVFADASVSAIAAVAYLRTVDNKGQISVGFVLGKAKVAPSHGHTIPRLELCAAVLATEIADFVCENLDVTLDMTRFYTDSKVVLGYIHNNTRRFYVYVANRVERIHDSSKPDQWSYIHTSINPADQGTRSVPSDHLADSVWITGPPFLTKENRPCAELVPLSNPDDDVEIRPHVSDVTTMVTMMSKVESLGSTRFSRFSSWKSLVEAIALLKYVARHVKTKQDNQQVASTKKITVALFSESERFIIKTVQHEEYAAEINCIQNKTAFPKNSSLLPLNPYIDKDGFLRVGGRLVRSDIDAGYIQPLIIPGRHHIAALLVQKHHEEVHHQGRHYTEGAVRSAGLWITGVKRLISSILHKCVRCRKLRGKPEFQKMSDLPLQRIQCTPPFTYVGLDTFGPWPIIARRTRGGLANAKRWAILFTCLSSRAVHIETVEEMSSSAFVNAFRRFVAIRGKVAEIHSDRGTNFVGATDALKIDVVHVESGPVQAVLYNNGTVWKFNPPHSSHMGGVWERMIGLARRILDSMLMDCRDLTHDVLVTFMAEVCAIINARPILPVSSDPEAHFLLSPATLLTQKVDHVPQALSTGDPRDMLRVQWKRVQALADKFWSHWKRDYLHTLQTRQKWQEDRPNVKVGDVVLLKDQDAARNQWPMGVISAVFPGKDGKVRKVIVRTTKDGKTASYTRPITEIVMLVSTCD